jgi:hypothetical protein
MVSAIGAFDADAAAVGGALRYDALRTQRAAIGVEAELGYAWAALSVPLAARIFDETWVYGAPRIGTWALDPVVSMLSGVSARVYDGVIVRGEGQLSYQGLQSYNQRSHFSFGAAYQF